MAEDKRKYNGRRKGSANEIQGQIKDKNITPNSSKTDFRDESNLSTSEFLKVRKGESQEDWEKRTKKKRVHRSSEKKFPIKVAQNGRLVISKRAAKNSNKLMQLKILVRFHERPFDFLKMYAFVMRWASVRFGIVKDDIELGYYFYEGTPFTKEEFEHYCAMLGAVRGLFSRFVKKGYLSNISITTDAGKIKETEYYQLSMAFNNVLSRVYDLISKTNPVNTKENWTVKKVNPDLRLEIEKMNDEIYEILSGAKKQEKIKTEN